jgi:hypothetical protein
MRILHLLHPFIDVDFLPFIDDVHFEIEVILDQEAFIFSLVHSPHLSFRGPSDMVYELLQNCFVPNDSMNGFDLFLRYVGTLLKVMFHPPYCTMRKMGVLQLACNSIFELH